MKVNSIQDRLTVVILTHYSPKEEYGEMAPPSPTIINKTLDSLWDRIPEVKCANHKLIYNRPKLLRGGAAEYQQNIFKLCADYDLSYEQYINNGLRSTLLRALTEVDTELIFFVEHDWEFIRSVNLLGIIETILKNNNINYVRLNKRPNEPGGAWNTMISEVTGKKVPLCKVSTFSNNPYIASTSWLKDLIIGSLPDLTFWYRSLKRPNSIDGNSVWDIIKILIRKNVFRQVARPLDDLERIVDTNYKHKINTWGFEYAHEQMGVYLYGGKGEEPYISHLGW